jgi:hypothetical protein
MPVTAGNTINVVQRRGNVTGVTVRWFAVDPVGDAARRYA